MKTHCKHGHEFTVTNTYIYADGRHKCKTCRKDGMRKNNHYQGNIPNSLKSCCKYGHLLSGNNLYISSNGVRRCKICHRLRARKYQQYKGNLPFGERTQCIKGHMYDENNTQYNINGYRRCRMCRLEQSRISRHKRYNLDCQYGAIEENLTKLAFNNHCFKCHTTEDLTIDHHYPLSSGFGLSLSNAVLLCRKCNSSKNDRPPEDFYTINELILIHDILRI